jgi:hypothetical protein
MWGLLIMMNVKETAKQIRKELKEKFTFTKFSVRCERTGSITVSWTDFPTEKAVEEIVSKYEQVQRCEVTGEILSGGNLFVFTRQTWSNELKNKIEDEMKNNYGESYLSDRACWYRAFNETAEKLYNEFLQSLEQPKETKQEQYTDVKATYSLNEELNGIEITFTGVPSEEVRNELKSKGFRWSKYKKVWYAKQSEERLQFAKMLASETEQTEEVTEQSEIKQETMQTKEVEQEHNTQQAEEWLQTESKEQPQKIKVKSITFLWSESPIIKDNTTVSTWAEANKIIKDIALYADDEGYTKTAFLVTWEDGTSYKGIMDVESKHYYKENPFSNEIYNDVLFLAGMKRPAHMTQESYNNYLDSIKSDRESWKAFLNTYTLHDEETKSPIDSSDQSGNNRDDSEFTTIVTEETQPLQEEVLFYHEALTEAQNAKINEILNRHKDSDKFTFVAVYKCKSEPQHAILHVVNELGEDQYFYFTTAGLFAFSTHEISYYDRHVYGVELLHTFTNNSDNMQELGNKQEEKAVNDTMQETENSNNTNETHELDILQEQSTHDTMQGNIEKLNNTLANESPEDLQVNNAHNTNQAQTLQVSYKINNEKNGIELYFSDKPNEAIREQLKQMGFKWSPMRSIWYAKKTDERLNFVQLLLSDSYNSELTEEQRKTLEKRLRQDNVKPLHLFKNGSDFVLLECLNTDLSNPQPFYFLIRPNGEEMGKGYDSDILNGYSMIYNFQHNSDQEKEPESYPYIDIDDIETYVIDEKLQEAEYVASWIFRTQKRDHTKEIQDFFMQYNNKVKELLEQTDNERTKYYLKKSLQSFKKRYFNNYVKILRHRSENPSWAVTGRGNLNKRRYDKALSRYDKLIQESIELTKQIDAAINRAKNEIQKEKEQRIKEAVKNVKNELTFTVMTKEINYMGYKERKRVYVYGDYWTARLWGCFRIFKGNHEIHEMKSNDKLDDAKRYIAYLVRQEKESQKVS